MESNFIESACLIPHKEICNKQYHVSIDDKPVLNELSANSISRLPSGYYVQTTLLEFEQLNCIIQLSNNLLKNGYTLCGSVIYFYIWAMKTNMSPTVIETVHAFMKSKFVMPKTITIFDTKFDITNLDIIKTIYNDKIDISPQICDSQINNTQNENVKHFKVSHLNTLNISYDIHFITNKNNLLNFDIDGVHFNLKNSLHYVNYHNHNCKDIQCRLNDVQIFTNAINNIYDKKAKFIGMQDNKYSRLFTVDRINQLINEGFYIDKLDPKYSLSCISTDYQDCCVCNFSFKCGEKMHKFICPKVNCCMSVTANYVCPECFWKSISSYVIQDKYYICPSCNDKTTLLFFSSISFFRLI